MLKRIRASLKCQKGFTLVELMAVIAIIGILAAIAVPQFASYTADATAARIVSDLRNIDIACSAAVAVNPGKVPVLGSTTDTNKVSIDNYLPSGFAAPTDWGLYVVSTVMPYHGVLTKGTGDTAKTATSATPIGTIVTNFRPNI